MFLSSLTQKQKEVFFCLAHNVVVSDGDLTVDENIMMEDMRREMNLSADFIPHYIDIDGIEHLFTTRRTRAIVMMALIKLSYADGAFEIEEQCFLKKLCAQFDLPENDFALADNWVKRLIALEREAQALMSSQLY